MISRAGSYWIAFKRDATDPSKFVAPDTGQISTFTNWDVKAGEPNGLYDCIVTNGSSGLWYTRDCSAFASFLAYMPGMCIHALRLRSCSMCCIVYSNIVCMSTRASV